jgi:hypothetical protein
MLVRSGLTVSLAVDYLNSGTKIEMLQQSKVISLSGRELNIFELSLQST